jgi:hypothetical protein
MSPRIRLPLLVLMIGLTLGAGAGERDSDTPQQQLPHKMHARMNVLPTIRVGSGGTGDAAADIIGTDNRAIQSAVDYVAGLEGGTVEIGPGDYVMHDSLHLRALVTVRGAADGKTILRKAEGVESALAADGDYGEEQVTLADARGFEVGYGVAVWDAQSGGFHTTVARITGRSGNTISISRPLNADCMVSQHAKAATVFPIVSGVDVEGVRIENLVIEGCKDHNANLNGCRGAGIYLYRGFGTVIQNCRVGNFNGDGISFQQSNDVTVRDCVSENNTGLGIHPGSGSQRPTVQSCVARGNGEDGLYLCWRVKFGRFEDNVLEANGRYGISIGHKDTDNVLRHNRVVANQRDGVCFRDEALAMAPHRNRLEENVIENNGKSADVAGIHIMGQTNDLVLRNNTIRDTRAAADRKQTVGVRIEAKAGEVVLEGNSVEAGTAVKDLRAAAAAAAGTDEHK